MGINVHAKRKAPAEISPILAGNKTIEEAWETTATGYAVYLIAKASPENAVKWKTKLYERAYNQDLEKDVQKIHLRSLLLVGDHLVAIDEKTQRYEVELASGKLLAPNQPVEYSKPN